MSQSLLTANTDSDARIIEGLKCHNPCALEDLYDRYGRIVFSVVFRIIQNTGEAEEIVQEVFLRIWTSAHLIDNSRGTLGPWLLTIARNLAIDYLRTARRRRQIYADGSHQSLLPSIRVESTACFLTYSGQLRDAFDNLTQDQRTVIEFAYFEGLSQSEISERMQKPLGTVKTWARTALCTLRKSFDVIGLGLTSIPPNSRAGTLDQTR